MTDTAKQELQETYEEALELALQHTLNLIECN